jgi:hypothetical protein
VIFDPEYEGDEEDERDETFTTEPRRRRRARRRRPVKVRMTNRGAADTAGITVSNIVVGATMGLALLLVTYSILGPFYGSLAAGYLIYEAYTLMNRHPDDTLSESVWRLSVRPIVPLVFGLAAGWGLGSGFLKDPAAGFAFGILYGHFFFQRQPSPPAGERG